MKNIIVPIDFSQDSINALNTAISIAKKAEAEIFLIHVNKLKQFAGFFSGQQISENPADIMNNFTELLLNIDNQGVKITSDTVEGRVDTEVVRLAEEKGAYLIVMGAHGISGERPHWAGSNAFKVVSHATCPVLTVRGDVEVGKVIKKIVLPIDTDLSTRHKVPFAIELALLFGAEIYVFAASMSHSQEFIAKSVSYATQAMEYIESFGVKCQMEDGVGNNITDMTIDHAQKVGADLIVIMTEQETAISNIFVGPYAEQMIHKSRIPVLSMHKNPKLDGDFSIM